MPHDKNGDELQEGDVVSLLCRVKSVQPNTDYCNCTLETVEEMAGSGKTTIVINTRQAVKAVD